MRWGQRGSRERASGPVSRSDWRQRTGEAAERLAADHLAAHGCEILERRFRCRGGEIDLVVRDGSVIAFVEVKARRSSRYGDAAEAVTRPKQRRVVCAARRLVSRGTLPPGPFRFDVVCVRLVGGRASLHWIRDAFRA